MHELGKSRVERELDLVCFIRHQMINRVMKKLSFTNNERFYMRH